MIEADVIIVGAGPAGSICAWKLKQAGFHVLLIDRHIASPGQNPARAGSHPLY